MLTSNIHGVKHLNYWQRLKALKLMSLQRWRERYTFIHMWKIPHKKCPNDVHVQFTETLWHGQKAVVPSQRNQTLFDSPFAVGPRLWNIEPTNLHLIEELLHFKSLFTEFVTSTYSRRASSDWL